MIKIGLLGLGTVGSGIFEIINDRKDYFKALTGDELVVSKILVKNLDKERKVAASKDMLTNDPHEILNDPAIDIVIEVIGGITEAYSYITCALNNGKHVVTANKAVVAEYMKNLTALAEKNKKAFLFEASVGGGIPIIKPLKQQAKLNDIREIKGILNGTSNFILSKMTEDKVGFHDALKLAQELGYAEADPTDDIKGYDAARKLAILSSIAFKSETKLENISCRGISSIAANDIEMFDQMGYAVKLLGKALVLEDHFSASTEPVLVKGKSMLATVNDAFNLISITGNTVGQLSFYGQGAGKDPTANAVVCDVIDVLTGAYQADAIVHERSYKVLEEGSLKGKYYTRITPRKKASSKYILDFLQETKLVHDLLKKEGHVIFITKDISPKKIEDAIGALGQEVEGCLYVRIEDACIPHC